MEGPRETLWTSMSAEDVLAVLMEDYRHQVLNDPEAEPDVTLTFDSTVADWRSARDLLPWRPLGMAMNERFGVEIQESRWHDLLAPPKTRTLRSVCEEIALTAKNRTVEPLRIFGRNCREAGIFFAVKRILREEGLNVSELRPSSEVFPYLREHWPIFVGKIAVLAPGRLPPLRLKDQVYNNLLILMGMGLVVAIGCGFMKAPTALTATAGFSASIAYVGLWIRAYTSKPLHEAAFGDIRTFADLCRVLSRARG